LSAIEKKKMVPRLPGGGEKKGRGMRRVGERLPSTDRRGPYQWLQVDLSENEARRGVSGEPRALAVSGEKKRGALGGR